MGRPFYNSLISLNNLLNSQVGGGCWECGGTGRLVVPNWNQNLFFIWEGKKEGILYFLHLFKKTSFLYCCSMPWEIIHILLVKFLKLFHENDWAILCLYVYIYSTFVALFDVIIF